MITTGWVHCFSSSIKATAVHYQILGWLCQICLLKVVFSFKFKHCYCINTNLSRWGASQKDGTSQEHLQEVELEYICNRECQRQFKSDTIFGESALKWCFKSTQERHLWRKGMDSWNWWRNQRLHVMCRCKMSWHTISFFYVYWRILFSFFQMGTQRLKRFINTWTLYSIHKGNRPL